MITSECILLLGSNLGDSIHHLEFAKTELKKLSVDHEIKSSSLYKTKAWGNTNQNDFLNQVVLIHSILSPEELLIATQQIETKAGRVRFEKWGPRTLDIDILYVGDTLFHNEHLTIPHAGIPFRRFCLEPLVELCPDFVHPLLGKTQKELLLACEDHGEVERINRG